MHRYHYLMTTLHLTLKMTTAQVVKMSVTNNSLSKDYSHPELDSEDDYRSGSQKSVTNNSLSKDYPHPELDSEDDYRSGS